MKRPFRQIDQMRGIPRLFPGQCRCRSDPAGIPSHGLNDAYVNRKGFHIYAYLGGRGRYVSCCTSIARRVIRNCDIVVNGFGNSNDTDILILTNLVNTSACIHGSISAI